MTKEKLVYTSPEVDLLVIRFEQGILTGSKKATGNAIPILTEEFDDWD